MSNEQTLAAAIEAGIVEVIPVAVPPAVEVVIVPEATCPECGAGANYHNRPKVGDADGTWWWRCYNPVCDVTYYNPETGGIQK